MKTKNSKKLKTSLRLERTVIPPGELSRLTFSELSRVRGGSDPMVTELRRALKQKAVYDGDWGDYEIGCGLLLKC